MKNRPPLISAEELALLSVDGLEGLQILQDKLREEDLMREKKRHEQAG